MPKNTSLFLPILFFVVSLSLQAKLTCDNFQPNEEIHYSMPLLKGECPKDTPVTIVNKTTGEEGDATWHDGRYKAFFIDTWYVNKTNSGDQYKWTSKDATNFGLNASRVDNPAYNIDKGDTAIYVSRETLTQAERDSRRYATYNLADNFKDPANPGKFYPTLKKNLCTNLFCGTNASKPYSSADCIIYRLAETYLLSAEIAWRMGDNATAAQRVNVIRNRACIGHDGSMNVTVGALTPSSLASWKTFIIFFAV